MSIDIQINTQKKKNVKCGTLTTKKCFNIDLLHNNKKY